MFGSNKTQASTSPFGTAPVFGSTSTFGAQQTTPVFGAGTGSNVFGNQPLQSQPTQAFSSSQSQGTPSLFGTSTQSSGSTPFSQTGQSTSGFATGTSSGFSTSTFGATSGVTTPTSSNPFSSTAQSSPNSNIFSAAMKATPSKSIFGGTSSQRATHPVFGGSSQRAQPSGETASIFASKSDSSSGSTFGSLGAGAMSGSGSQTSSSQPGKGSFVAAKDSSQSGRGSFGATKGPAEKPNIFQSATSGGPFGDSPKLRVVEKIESILKIPSKSLSRKKGPSIFSLKKIVQLFSDNKEGANLLGKATVSAPVTSSSTQSSSSSVQPLFGKTTSAPSKPSQLFGKTASANTEPKSGFGQEKDEANQRPSLFGKSTVDKIEEKGIFASPTDDSEQKPLFGKGASDVKPLFGKESEQKTLFGKTADTQPSPAGSPERRNNDSGESENVPRRIRNWGGGRKTAKAGAKPAVGLFGKALASVASAAEHDTAIEEPEGSVKSVKPVPRIELPVSNPKPRRRTSEEYADKLSIVAKNVPKVFNDKGMLKIHFSKFGKITRLYHNENKQAAIITYDSPESAQKAIEKGKVIKKGVPQMALFWKSGTPSKKSGATAVTKRTEGGKRRGDTERGRMPSFDGDVNDELKSMSGTGDVGTEEIHFLERPDARQPLKSGRDRGQGRTRSSSPAPAISEATRRVRTDAERTTRSRSSEAASGSTRKAKSRSPSPKPKKTETGMYRHSSMNSLIGTVGHTAEERLDVLENRDRIIRAGLGDRDTNLTTAQVLKGTCPDMCPETERYKREARRLLHPYEVLQIPGGNPREPKVDHSKAVKEYSRSSADQEMPLPHELRPSPVLNRTMIYLLNNIADLGGDGKWADWFEFLWSRTRGIRKDVTQQQLYDIEAVGCVEKCARFHIYCAERLCEEDPSVFDAKINSENLTKCLQTLREMYQDMEVKNVSYCLNEAEFRAYMVLMKLNEGDILRETQQLREEIRGSPQVKFVLKVYSALNSNNYIKFFKLAKQGTFLNSCLMHRYFNQVRMAALRTISKSYVPSAQAVQYQLSELVRLLAFEDESEAATFCEHYGYYCEEGRVFLERNAFIMPESNLAPRRGITLVESKQRTSVGQVMNGGPLPPNILIKPTTSFDERGRFTVSSATLPVQEEMATAEPTQVQPDVSTQVVSAVEQETSQQEVIKEVAKDLLIEVTDEMVHRLSNNLIDMLHAMTTDVPVILASVINETTDGLLKEISSVVINEMKIDKAEKEAAERKEKLAAKARAAELISDEILQEGVNQEIRRVAEEQYQENQTKLKEESQHRMSEQVRNTLYDSTVAEEIIKIVLEFHKTEVEDKIEILNECEESVRRLRQMNAWRKWKNAYAGRTRLKRSMLTFPPAPSMNSPQEQLREILPLSQGVRADTVHLGNSAELTLEAPPLVRIGRTANYMNMSIYKHNQRVRRERAWRPLNIVSAISQEMLDRYGNRKKTSSELHIFWKLVLSLPDGNETLTDWLKAKFRKGSVPNGHPDSKVSVLSLYSAAVENGRRPTSLHVCISGCHGDLDEGDVWEIEQKCHFLGTSAILFVVDVTEDAYEDEAWWLCEQLRLSRLMQAKPAHPALPLVVLIHQSEGSKQFSSEQITLHLNLERCKESASVSEYTIVYLEDVIDDPSLTEQLLHCIEWLSLHCPKEPDIYSKDVVEYVEEKMDTLFTTPVYQNLALRRKNGLLDQAPEVLIDVYNALIDHMVKQVTDPALKRISWPVPEFTSIYSELPQADWNKAETLAQLEELLPHLLFPDPEAAQADSWDMACSEVWQFVEMVVESGEGNKVEMYSRIRWLLRKAKHDFEELTWFVEGTSLSPTAFNLPWTEIIMSCVNYRIGGIKILIADSQEESEGISQVHYFKNDLHRFVYPESWTQATKEISPGLPKLETTIAIASQKRKLDTSSVSETSPKQARKDSTSPEATSPTGTASDAAAPVNRLELSQIEEYELEADESAFKLSVSLANEKSEAAKYEEYLQSLVTAGESDSFLWDIGAGFSPIASNTPPGAEFGVMLTRRTSFSQTPTAKRYSLPSNARYSFEDRDVVPEDKTLNETLEHLQESIKSSREADKLYEMKLRSLLIDTP